MAISATATNSRQQKRSWRWWLFVTVLCMVPVGFVLFAYVATRFTGQMRLEQAFAEADRLDPGWRFDDLEAHRLAYPEPDKNGIEQVQLVRKAMPPTQWPEWPFPKFDKDKAYLEQVRDSMNQSLEGDRLAPTLLNTEQERVVRAELARAATAIELARRMPDYHYGRYPIKWTKDFVSTLLPHVQDAREIANLMKYDARLRANDNDLESAFHDVKATLYASRAVGDEEFFISQLVRIAVDFVAAQALERSLACGRVSETTLLDLQKEFEREAQTPFFLTGARGERAGLNYLLENVQEGKVTFGEYRRLMSGAAAGFALLGTRAPKGILLDLITVRMYLNMRGERAQMLHYLNEAIELAKLAPWEALNAIEAKDNALGKNPPYWTFLLNVVNKICRADVRAKAVLRTAYTALAMERFNLAKGRWPDKFQDLVPLYLSEVPLDPFDGVPLRLIRKGHAIIVYSVGIDKEDNGGAVELNPGVVGSDIGFVLQDPAQRRQPGKPFQFPERPTPPAQEPEPDKP